ncbi:DUF397 domain-containing protein [Micromonospora zamorensis]|uniref:DUF397 domain-containing protein n=1 Tax=Micromonospora zamorensis TaxID=709883 RepID=UPI0036A63C19
MAYGWWRAAPASAGAAFAVRAEEGLRSERPESLGYRVVGVRDSKDPAGPALAFDPAAWTRFLALAKHG